MKKIGKDILYFEASRFNKPVCEIETGEVVEIETQMNRGPWIETHPDREYYERALTGGNPSSGCLYVKGAEPGMMISVTIEAIDLGPVGYTQYSGNTGAMPSYLGPNSLGNISKIVAIENNKILWSDKLTLEAKPMIGYVGVAPDREIFHNGWGGYWGGNMDIQEVAPGTTVHLPVMVSGALLQIGDMHAIQGDGEICGAGGIETEGKVRISCTLSDRPKGFNYPRLENNTHIMAVAMAKPTDDAFRSALESLVLWMEADYGFTREEAYMLLAQVMEARCTQFVNPSYTYIAKIKKRYLI
jgi:amidase